MKISKKIPIPADLGLPRTKYPWMEMEVGDSFEVDSEAMTTVRSAANMANARAKNGERFYVGQDPKGQWRCWRTV